MSKEDESGKLQMTPTKEPKSLQQPSTSQVKLTQLQRQLKGLLNANFEFRNTRNETRVVMKETADFSATHSHFESNKFP
jgi:hypothetical protein